VGEDVESILYKLYQAANYDVAAAQVGIVYVDEVRAGLPATCTLWLVAWRAGLRRWHVKQSWAPVLTLCSSACSFQYTCPWVSMFSPALHIMLQH
jgi:hypothetical protein